VIQPNILVCLTQEAYNKFYRIIRPGGLLVTDTRYVKTQKKVDAQQRELAMYQTVMDKIGKPLVFNICMLGAVIGMTDLISPDSIMRVLENRIPADFLEINRQAMDLGLELGGKFRS
jgi:2-oxoglutarate ferredoxin oxidoreductase subunit gamma